MDEILTIDEIRTRYAPDWVRIGEPQVDEDQRLCSGKVRFHSPDREAVYRKAIEMRPGHFAFRYLGSLPKTSRSRFESALQSRRVMGKSARAGAGPRATDQRSL
jgi:hypothetical protein